MPDPAAVGSEAEAGVWTLADGVPSEQSASQVFRADGVEYLTYSNPFGQSIERVWYDDQIVFALALGEVNVEPARVAVAQAYQIVRAVDLGADGRPRGKPETVVGQYAIFDALPGTEAYSPLRQLNYVVVPADHAANTLRSQRDCLTSGFPIRKSRVVLIRPVA